MKGKTLGILLLVVVVLGGAWIFSFKSNRNSWSQSGTGGGSKVVEFPLNDVARINIKSPTSELNLVKKGEIWTVQERADYPASFEQVSGLLRKLWELKTVQEVKVGPSQFARLELVEPGKGDAAGTLVQLFGADGKPLQALLLGKKQMRKGEGGDDQFGGMSAGFATGRYVKPTAGATVSLVSDPLDDVDPKPERWLAKDFIKVESPKSIAVAGAVDAGDQKPAIVPTPKWTVTRENATAEWKLADAKPDEKLDTGKVSGLGNVLSSAGFNDVQADAKLDEPITTATIETFDGFQYDLKIGKAKDDNQPVLVTVSGNFPKERTPAADEKPEDKKRLDDEFTAKQKANEEKLAKEKTFEGRAYLVSKFSVEPLLKDRAALLAEKPLEPVKPPEGSTPAAPGTPGEPPKPGTPPAATPAPAKPATPAKPVPAVKPATPAPVKPVLASPPPPKAVELPKPESAKPVDAAKPVEPAKPESAKPADAAKPVEPAKPESAKPADAVKPVEPAASAPVKAPQPAKPTEPAAPAGKP
ncbi:MAG TPA: DUF4340 domain-containing protein [Chthoniobacteraceae bacterium]|jgi:hypothetical protein|nr:DUF4340 domain-containing protein [Chthoniobacteraceae bacterium]